MLQREVSPGVVDPAARRQAVAAAVFRVVVRDGVERASLRNVALEAGLAIGSIRHCFDGHDAMIAFAVEALIHSIEDRADLRPAEQVLSEVLPLDDRRRPYPATTTGCGAPVSHGTPIERSQARMRRNPSRTTVRRSRRLRTHRRAPVPTAEGTRHQGEGSAQPVPPRSPSLDAPAPLHPGPALVTCDLQPSSATK